MTKPLPQKIAPERVCPLLERSSETLALPYAPAPWVLRQCRESGFVYLANPPGYEAFVENLAWEKTSLAESAHRQRAEPVLYAMSTAIKRFRSSVLKRNKIGVLALAELKSLQASTLNLLDVGCGWGGLLGNLIDTLPSELQPRAVPHGIEISRELARQSHVKMSARAGKCVHADAVSGLGTFPDQYFHLAILSSFLEHEHQPLPLLRALRDKLVPGGSVIVKVPNYACLNRTARGNRWCGFRWPDHVNYFTPKTLREAARLTGLEVSRMRFLDRHPLSDNMYAVLRRPS